MLAQVASAAALLVVVVRGARREGAPLRPDLPGIRAAAHAAVALVVRTLTLRAALLVTTYAVTLGAADAAGQAVDLATHQLALTLWTFLAFALDAIAIAAQAITGRYLGAGDVAGTRAVTRRMVQWGVVERRRHRAAAGRWPARWLGALFTAGRRRARPAGAGAAGRRARPAGRRGGLRARRRADRRRRRAPTSPAAGWSRWSPTRPLALVAAWLSAGLVAVWVLFTVVFMGARLVVLVHRARGDAWLVTGTRGARAVPDPA